MFVNQYSIDMGDILRICYTDFNRETFLNAPDKT